MTIQGTFILADIGGYTSFLTGVGITHAREITEHLLNRLVKTSQGSWKVGNIMGDCVLFYTEGAESPDRTFAGLRSMHEAFQDAQTEVISGSTCRCGACDRTHELSLKFVVHAGEFDLQKIGGRRELIGHDVVLATRLLKNSVPVREYVIATASTAAVLAAAGTAPVPARDDLEAIGLVDYTYIDLAPVREARTKSREVYLTDDDATFAFAEEINAAVETVWNALLDLDKRAIWQVPIRELDHVVGEAGTIGEVHQCLHHSGSKIVHLTVAVDRESHRKTERLWITPAIARDVHMTYQVDELPDGRARATFYGGLEPRIPIVSHIAWPFFLRLFKNDVKKELAGLKEFCETGKVAAREPTRVA